MFRFLNSNRLWPFWNHFMTVLNYLLMTCSIYSQNWFKICAKIKLLKPSKMIWSAYWPIDVQNVSEFASVLTRIKNQLFKYDLPITNKEHLCIKRSIFHRVFSKENRIILSRPIQIKNYNCLYSWKNQYREGNYLLITGGTIVIFKSYLFELQWLFYQTFLNKNHGNESKQNLISNFINMKYNFKPESLSTG